MFSLGYKFVELPFFFLLPLLRVSFLRVETPPAATRFLFVDSCGMVVLCLDSRWGPGACDLVTCGPGLRRRISFFFCGSEGALEERNAEQVTFYLTFRWLGVGRRFEKRGCLVGAWLDEDGEALCWDCKGHGVVLF